MNPSHKLAALLVSSSLAFLTGPAYAQTTAPVEDAPPAVTPSSDAPVSLTEATNSTGQTSRSGTMKEWHFTAVDTDSDGFISRAEFMVFMDSTGARSSGGVSSDMPTSGSSGASSGQPGLSGVAAGTTSRDSTSELFRLIDQDNNGFLSEAELTTHQKNHRTQR